MTKWLNPLHDLRRGSDSYYRCFFSLLDYIYIRGESKQCLEPGEPRAPVISAFEKISTGVNKERKLRPKADPGACKAQRKFWRFSVCVATNHINDSNIQLGQT